MLPQFGQLTGQLDRELVPVIAALLPSVKSLAEALTTAFAKSLVIVFQSVVQLLPQMVQLAVQWTPIIDQVTKFLPLLAQLSVMYLPQLMDVITDTARVILWFEGQWTTALTSVESVALRVWHDVLDPMWQGITSGASQAVGLLAKAWNGIESAFKVPVNWVIQYVYDDGIAKLWNDVTGAVGLSSLKLPIIPALARGGVLPGYAPGHDTVPALLSPGEAVLTPGATRAIGGKPAVDALNSAYAPPGGKGGPGRFSLGGLVGDITGTVSGLLSGGVDVAKATAALVTGNTTAFVNALIPVLGGPAAGSFGKIIAALPKTMMTDAVQALTGLLGGAGSASLKVPGTVMQWISQGMQTAGVTGADWQSGLDIIAMHESGGNQGAVNNWDSNAAAGTPSAGLMQFTLPTFSRYAMPGHTAWMNPVNQVIADSWDRGYIKSVYGSIDNVPGVAAVRAGRPYVGYDSGGWLPPGITATVNQTGQPEAVLSQQQWQDTADLTAAVRQLTEHLSGASGGAAAPSINLNYFGPQEPTPEQRAMIYRDLDLLMG